MSWPHERWIGPYELKGHRVDAYLGSSWKARRRVDAPWVRVRVIDAVCSADPALRDALCEGAFWEMELSHPNVAQVIDLVVEQDVLALVSPFIPGRDLLSLLEIARQANLAIPQGVLLRVADDVLAALIALEDAARDTPELENLAGGLHPDCVHVGLDGRTRLSDVTASAILSRNQDVEGGPRRGSYRAPEHWEQLEADARADVFVLGSLLWEALSRRRLVRADLPNLLAREGHEPGRWIKQQMSFRGEPIPSALAELVTQALQPDRELRHGGYGELRAALADSQLALATRDQVAAFLQSLPGGGSRDKRAADPQAVQRASAFEERSTAETPILLGEPTVPELDIPALVQSQSVALVHVVDAVPTAPPVVLTNQPPGRGATSRRRVRVAILAASVLAGAALLTLWPRGSRTAADRDQPVAAREAPAVAEPTPAPSPPAGARPNVTAAPAPARVPAQPRVAEVGAREPAATSDLALAPDAGPEAIPRRAPSKPRATGAHKPARPHPSFTPSDI